MDRRHLVASLVVVIGSSAAARASIIYVDDDAPNDPCPGDALCSDPIEDGSIAHPFDAIQEALDVAVMGDEVIVADGVYSGTGNKNLDFSGKAIVLRSAGGAAGCIIDCELDGRGFDFHSGETPASVLDGLTIRNGNVVFANGGGILCNASSPTIRNCVFESNNATGNATHKVSNLCDPDLRTITGYGGGLYCSSANPVISDCVFTGNNALTTTEFGTSGGGGVACVQSSPQLTDCLIDNNRADGVFATSFGGGILIAHGSSPTLLNCTIMANTASLPGGGVMVLGCSDPSIQDCQITGNTAGTNGGGMVCAIDSSPIVTGCQFSGNTAQSGGGGAIWINQSDPIILNSTFIGNTSSGDDGGGAIGMACSSPSIQGCQITDNTAAFDGGGISCRDGSDPIVSGCLFSGNDAEDGGGVFARASDPNILNSTFVGNDSSGNCGGGAIAATVGSEATVSNAVIIGNHASHEGGGTVAIFSTMLISNSTIVANEADGLTGGVCTYGSSAVTTVRNSIVYSNRIPDGLTDPQVIDLPLADPPDTTTTIEYSNIEGGWTGAGSAVIDIDPDFMNPPDSGPDDQWGTPDDNYGDVRLSPRSPCVDAGVNWLIPRDATDLDGDGDTSELLPLDADGNPRFADAPGPDVGCGVPATVDIGALEAPGVSVNPIVYADITGDGVVDIDDVIRVVLDWGPCDGCCLSDLDVDGQVGFDEVVAVILNWS